MKLRINGQDVNTEAKHDIPFEMGEYLSEHDEKGPRGFKAWTFEVVMDSATDCEYCERRYYKFVDMYSAAKRKAMAVARKLNRTEPVRWVELTTGVDVH